MAERSSLCPVALMFIQSCQLPNLLTGKTVLRHGGDDRSKLGPEGIGVVRETKWVIQSGFGIVPLGELAAYCDRVPAEYHRNILWVDTISY